MQKLTLIIIGAVIALGIAVAQTQPTSESAFSPYVDDDGNISFPHHFRTNMVHLGSWFVPEGGASGFHDVYAEKAAVEFYRETGEFPDGATLVKELRASDQGDFTTGQGVSFATGELKQWFVMIKDRRDRFAGNTIWGDGWGWGLFMPDDLKTNVAKNYQSDCLGCHVPAQDQDWVYTQAYPTLSSFSE